MSALAVGRDSITAEYGGNTNETTSTSRALTQTVIDDDHHRQRIAKLHATRQAGDIHGGGRGESPGFGHQDANGNLL